MYFAGGTVVLWPSWGHALRIDAYACNFALFSDVSAASNVAVGRPIH